MKKELVDLIDRQAALQKWDELSERGKDRV